MFKRDFETYLTAAAIAYGIPYGIAYKMAIASDHTARLRQSGVPILWVIVLVTALAIISGVFVGWFRVSKFSESW